MPRLALRVKLAEVESEPPTTTRLPGVGEAGGVPRFASLLTDKFPPETVVTPL